MNFFKTRFFCILLIIAIVLALVPAVCTATGNTYILTNLINTIVTPAERLLADICDGLSGYGRYFSAIEELRAENDRLREELAAYISRVEDLENASRDYEWLSAYIGMKKILEESEYVRAEICRRTDVGGSIRYVIDKGSIHGIGKGMAVICGDGVFGTVVEVGINWATVCTPLDTTVGFGIKISSSGERGYTVGDRNLTPDGLFRVKFIDSDVSVSVGDTLVSVGTENIPEGVAVGTVERVEHNEYDRSTEAVVRPSADFIDEYALMVIIKNEYKIVEVAPPKPETDASTETSAPVTD
jgi:rod shape-determining protein MreC